MEAPFTCCNAEGGPTSPASSLQGDLLSSAAQALAVQKLEDEGAELILLEDLQAVMHEVAADIKAWSSSNFAVVKRLQDAERNQGSVELMRSLPDEGRLVAVKRMPTKWVCKDSKEFGEQHPKSSERPWVDLGLLRKLNALSFPFVCTLHKVLRSPDETFVVSSYCTEGDLFTWCGKETVPSPGKNREKHMLPIVAQIFTAVRWLHEFGIAHRDLSLENILLTRTDAGDLCVKIIDFGMSTLAQVCGREVRGKLAYQAPEMHEESHYDGFLADGFALGVVLFGMAAQDYPWSCTKRKSCQLFEYVSMFGLRRFLENRKLRQGNGERLIQVFSPALTELMAALLEIQPSCRPSLGEQCFSPEATGRNRRSVWDLAWVHGGTDSPNSAARGRTASTLSACGAQGIVRLTTLDRQRSDCSESGSRKMVRCWHGSCFPWSAKVWR